MTTVDMSQPHPVFASMKWKEVNNRNDNVLCTAFILKFMPLVLSLSLLVGIISIVSNLLQFLLCVRIFFFFSCCNTTFFYLDVEFSCFHSSYISSIKISDTFRPRKVKILSTQPEATHRRLNPVRPPMSPPT